MVLSLRGLSSARQSQSSSDTLLQCSLQLAIVYRSWIVIRSRLIRIIVATKACCTLNHCFRTRVEDTAYHAMATVQCCMDSTSKLKIRLPYTWFFIQYKCNTINFSVVRHSQLKQVHRAINGKACPIRGKNFDRCHVTTLFQHYQTSMPTIPKERGQKLPKSQSKTNFNMLALDADEEPSRRVAHGSY